MGVKKRSLSSVERGKSRYQNHKRSQLGACGLEGYTKERPRLFQARHGAGERVESNAKRGKKIPHPTPYNDCHKTVT
jgi:hypothetical protein